MKILYEGGTNIMRLEELFHKYGCDLDHSNISEGIRNVKEKSKTELKKDIPK